MVLYWVSMPFGLEECGDYDAAFRMGSQALERNPLDAWATHAVAHVYEMQTRQQEGVTFLTDTRLRLESSTSAVNP